LLLLLIWGRGGGKGHRCSERILEELASSFFSTEKERRGVDYLPLLAKRKGAEGGRKEVSSYCLNRAGEGEGREKRDSLLR